MEEDCGEGENGNGFQLLGWGRIGGSKQGILEEHDFRPYSQYGEKKSDDVDLFDFKVEPHKAVFIPINSSLIEYSMLWLVITNSDISLFKSWMLDPL